MLKRHALGAAFVLTILLPFTETVLGQSDNQLSGDVRILHVLNRLTFGPGPGDVEEVRRIGLENWIDLQMHPERLPENPVLEQRLQPLETLQMKASEIVKQYPGVPGTVVFFGGTVVTTGGGAVFIRRSLDVNSLLTADQRQTLATGSAQQILDLLNSLTGNSQIAAASSITEAKLTEFPELRRPVMRLLQPQQVPSRDLREGKVYRAVYSTHQLEEVLVDFWFNHFNVFEGKANVRNLVASYEREAIRPHVFGKFEDMLVATAGHPAMLLYLDNWESMSPDVFNLGPGQNVRLHGTSSGLNENYGRELLELHTLGVDGGYRQKDVLNAALAFTGWTIRAPNDLEFMYASFAHHDAEKRLLGYTIPAGGGIEDGKTVLRILAHHPSTARFISKELAKRFVADNPPQSLVDQMAETFRQTEGDLRAVLETLFTSDEFFSEDAVNQKVKSPLELAVSAVRALQSEPIDADVLAQKIADMGQPLYNKAEPTGYPNTAEIWLSTSGLLNRIKFASAITSGQIPGVKIDSSRFEGKDAAVIAREILGHDASPETLAALAAGIKGIEATPSAIAALVIGSPDFQKR